jgi:hypothetical protein
VARVDLAARELKVMRNTLTDLQNHFFAQLERLGDENLNAEQLKTEIERSKAITQLGHAAISNARLTLDADIHFSEMPENFKRKETPALLK